MVSLSQTLLCHFLLFENVGHTTAPLHRVGFEHLTLEFWRWCQNLGGRGQPEKCCDDGILVVPLLLLLMRFSGSLTFPISVVRLYWH